MNSPEGNNANRWRKASYSNGQGACVEIGRAAGHVMTRDTKQAAMGDARTVLRVPDEAWQEFTASLR